MESVTLTTQNAWISTDQICFIYWYSNNREMGLINLLQEQNEDSKR